MGVAGSIWNKTNSAFNWVEVEVEAELGNIFEIYTKRAVEKCQRVNF